VIFPYLNGDDLNSRPDSSASRWIIDFKERTESEARRYKEPWAIVERLVKPERITKDADKYPRMVNEWWKYWNARPGLYGAMQGMDQVVVIALMSKTVMPIRVPTGQVFSHRLGVFVTDRYAAQVLLSSSLHENWARKYSATLETRMHYAPSDVFETFPQPNATDRMASIGLVLNDARRQTMLRRQLGLTSLYNLVNDPDRTSDSDVDKLREIHVEVDEAVMEAYGWTDVPLEHGIHAYRQVERFTVSPAARVEILDRLLEENHRRAGAEAGGAGASVGERLLGVDDEFADEGAS
jgi:hypothetical protein